LPDKAVVVEEIKRPVRKQLSSEEINQIIIDYTENQMGVCQIANKYGCHFSTISKMLKSRLTR
jgi:transposase-like protein